MITPDRSTPAARRRLAVRVLGVCAALGFVIGLIVGATTESGTERVARQFTQAWERGDFSRMYSMLTPGVRKGLSLTAFKSQYDAAAATATAVGMRAGKVHGSDVDVELPTRIFGVIRGRVHVPVVDDHVAWVPQMVFPGVKAGEQLTRRTVAPRRAKILSREGKTIVSGPASARVVAPLSPAASIVGEVGPPTQQADKDSALARGFPPGTPMGLTGLERALDRYVAGRPGGELLVGGRRVASSAPVAAPPVASTIDLRIQAAAVTGLAGRFGGIAALEPGTGRVRALAGIAFSAPQPPGSTFKMVTATAALKAHIVKPSSSFPVSTKAVIDGVDLQNANGESCGGSFAESFAESCNSVFAPLGVKLGAKRLVGMAEKFGFNELPTLPGAAPSTLPPAEEVGSDLAVGSTAIGQGKVLATPLEMAVVADTIASGGVRHRPVLVEKPPVARGIRVVPKRVARIVERLMIGVVDHGTGTAAALPGLKVAGKTGTAELQTTQGEPPPGETGATGGATDTDAWFAAFAPAGRRHARIAVGVLFVKAGAGGATAAPAARVVLAEGVARKR